MCRFVAYVGPRAPLASILYEPVQSLAAQARKPRMQTFGDDNADGFGVAWYDRALREEPARYRNPRPMWEDRSFESLAGIVTSEVMIGAVRAATPGLAIGETNTPPYVHGIYAFAHNGTVEGFVDDPSVLRGLVSERRRSVIEGTTDSEVLFALVLDRIDRGATGAEALADVLPTVDTSCGGRMNLVMSDGSSVWATAWGNSLVTLERDGARVVASEPFDDETDWQHLDDRTVVTLTRDAILVEPIEVAAR